MGLVEAALGVIVFEGTLVSVQGPMERAARSAQRALDGEAGVAELRAPLQGEIGAFLVILGVGIANVLIGIWRPRLLARSDQG